MELTGWRWVAVGCRDGHELGRVRKSIFFVAATGDYCILDVQSFFTQAEWGSEFGVSSDLALSRASSA